MKAYSVRQSRKTPLSKPYFPACLFHVEQPIAVNKPKSISSAQALREIRKAFNPSKLFASWLENERAVLAQIDRVNNFRRHRRSRRLNDVRLGHGGTLDPMATGVLIVGVGNGTKHLQSFLDCTKTYEATVLFGAATDTYDVMGKVLAKAPYEHVTKQKVEDALASFRGKIMQRPPIYSALRMEGKKLYEYAREGKELPREIQERPMEVKELEIIQWLEAPDHNYQWPSEEAGVEEKLAAKEVLHLEKVNDTPADPSDGQNMTDLPSPTSGKRKRVVDEDDDLVQSTSPLLKRREEDPSLSMSGAIQSLDEPASIVVEASEPSSVMTKPVTNQPSSPQGPPAVKLRMTVTSGFYVRSLSHDLGKKVGSLAIMSELVRTRQGDFNEIEKGEECWGPRIERLLDDWQQNMSDPNELSGEPETSSRG